MFYKDMRSGDNKTAESDQSSKKLHGVVTKGRLKAFIFDNVDNGLCENIWVLGISVGWVSNTEVFPHH